VTRGPPCRMAASEPSGHEDEPNDERRRTSGPRSISMMHLLILDDLIKAVKVAVNVGLTA
jgi:hypothetical protein